MAEKIINERIRANTFVLISESGQKMGIYSKINAMSLAKIQKLDLVQLSQAKMGSPAVCKLMDYSKIKYEEKKNEKKNKQSSTSSITKEIQFTYNTEKHDLETKNRHVMEFLEKGHKVKYTMKLKNGQGPRRDDERYESLVFGKYAENISAFDGKAKWENPKSINFGTISVVLSPLSE